MVPGGRGTLRNAGRGRGASGAGVQRNDVLMAAAMQDHFLRNLNVSLPGMARKKPVSTRPEKVVPIDAKDPSAEQVAKKLTLAQKMGLVPMPPAKLSHEEWQQVAAQSRQRQDSCQECAICMETFKDETQVLLSCSHVFHQTCLASFERFSGRATCPLCRHADYEKRLFDEGRKNWEKLCTLKLQAVWRGHCGRKIWNHLLDTVVPTDPAKKRAFFARRMGKLTTKLLSALDHNTSDLEALFAESDQAISASRQVFNAHMSSVSSHISSHMSSLAAPSSSTHSLSSCETSTADRWAALRMEMQAPCRREAEEGGSSSRPGCDSSEGIDWAQVEAAALSRDEQECAICLGDLGGPERHKALTNCGHIFHAQCLGSFERFATAVSADRHRQTLLHEPTPERPKCPCCRAHYTKRIY